MGKFEVNELITRQRQKIFQDKYQVLCSKENLLFRVRQPFPTPDKILAGRIFTHLKDINSEQFRDSVFVQNKADDVCKKKKSPPTKENSPILSTDLKKKKSKNNKIYLGRAHQYYTDFLFTLFFLRSRSTEKKNQ